MNDSHEIAGRLEVSARDGEDLTYDVGLLLRQLNRIGGQLHQVELSDDEARRIDSFVEEVASTLALLQEASTRLIAVSFDIKAAAHI